MSDRRERYSITAEILAKRAGWIARFVFLLGSLATFVLAALSFMYRRSLSIRDALPFPDWYLSSPVYQDPWILFAVGLGGLIVSLWATS